MRRNKSQSEFSLCHVDFYSRTLKTRGSVFVGYCSNTPGHIKLTIYNWYVSPFPEKMNESNTELPQTCWEEGCYKGHSLKFVINNTESSKTSAASDVDWVCSQVQLYKRKASLSQSHGSVLWDVQKEWFVRASLQGTICTNLTAWKPLLGEKNREVIQVWHQLFLWKKKKNPILKNK